MTHSPAVIDGDDFPDYPNAQFIALYIGDEDGLPVIISDHTDTADIQELISAPGQRAITRTRLRRLLSALY